MSKEKMGTAMQQTPALAYWMAAFLVMPITAILRYTGCFHKRKGTARRAAAYKWEKGGAYGEPHSGPAGRPGGPGVAAAPPPRAAAESSPHREEWNEALSQAAGRRIFCPSYRTLSDYLHRLVLGVQ